MKHLSSIRYNYTEEHIYFLVPMGTVFILTTLRNQEMHLVDNMIFGKKMMKIEKITKYNHRKGSRFYCSFRFQNHAQT